MRKILETLSATGIRARIIAGFGTLVVLLAAIAFLYDMQLRAVRTEMETVVTAADASEALARFDRNVLDTRRLVTQYIGSSTAAEQVAALDAQSQVLKELDEVRRFVGGAADEIAASLDQYRKAFDQLVSQIKGRQAAYSTIVASGANLGNAINALTTDMVRNGQFDATVPARLQENVQAYVNFAARYMARGGNADADNAAAELDRVTLELATLKGLAVYDPWLKAVIARLEAPIGKLVASQPKLVEATRGVQAANTELVAIGTKIGRDVGVLNAQYISSRNLSVESARATVSSVLLTGLATSAGAILLGIGIAFVISTSIATLVRRITATMQQLAGGHLTTDVPDTGRTDDIGAMARAVEVFKQNGLKAQSLEAEASQQRNLSEEERRRNAEIERNRAEAMAQATRGLAEGLANLSRGNLAYELREPFASDFENLRTDFNAAVSQLRETLAAVAIATNSITGGSHEISQGADDLSKRTEQQAASLEQTAAALDQITTNVANASKRADEARQIAAEANGSARQAGDVVSNAINAMEKISTSSAEISNIISVIDEIAFQTNLLALNAGVEAARAGEAGKGFAVVAQEVRELAQRSAKAAKEIKGLIVNSTTHVEGGVRLVNETGTALRSIEGYIVNINGHMNAIATSAREQSVGLSEVNKAINQMDQVTQQNAAMVEQTSAAGSTLATEAGRLREMINQFQLDLNRQQSPASRQTGPVAVERSNRSTANVPSPARRMTDRITRAFSGGSAAAATQWEEF